MNINNILLLIRDYEDGYKEVIDEPALMTSNPLKYKVNTNYLRILREVNDDNTPININTITIDYNRCLFYLSNVPNGLITVSYQTAEIRDEKIINFILQALQLVNKDIGTEYTVNNNDIDITDKDLPLLILKTLILIYISKQDIVTRFQRGEISISINNDLLKQYQQLYNTSIEIYKYTSTPAIGTGEYQIFIENLLQYPEYQYIPIANTFFSKLSNLYNIYFRKGFYV